MVSMIPSSEPPEVVKRRVILERISGIVGFPITEADCSSQHRAEISQLISDMTKKDAIVIYPRYSVSPKRVAIFALLMFSLSAIALFPLVFFRLQGFYTFIYALLFIFVLPILLFHWLFPKIDNSQLEKSQREEASRLSKGIETRIIILAASIKDYLLKVDKARAGLPVVDFGRLLTALEKKGIMLQTIECPNCGGKLTISEVPKKEEIVECRHCGKPILAMNVFEKFKDILGS